MPSLLKFESYSTIPHAQNINLQTSIAQPQEPNLDAKSRDREGGVAERHDTGYHRGGQY
jgi:hypothetical protein